MRRRQDPFLDMFRCFEANGFMTDHKPISFSFAPFPPVVVVVLFVTLNYKA